MSGSLPGSSVGFGPQGFGASAAHFSQPLPAYGPPPLPPPPPAAAAAGPAQFDYSHGLLSSPLLDLMLNCIKFCHGFLLTRVH